MRTALVMVLALAAAGLPGGRDAAPSRAPSSDPDTLPAGVTPALVAQGRELFTGAGYCSSCHGATGRGVIGPDLADSAWWHSDGSYEAVTRTVTSGITAAESRSGVAMPARGGARLSDAEVRAVAAYVWTLRLDADEEETSTADAHRHRARHRHGVGGCPMAAPPPGCRR